MIAQMQAILEANGEPATVSGGSTATLFPELTPAPGPEEEREGGE